LDAALGRALARALTSLRNDAFARALAHDIAQSHARARRQASKYARRRVQRDLKSAERNRKTATLNRRRPVGDRKRFGESTQFNVGAFDHARARELTLGELEEELSALTLPGAEATAGEWQNYAEKLRTLVVRHRQSGGVWKLTEKQETLLDVYLNAAFLLQDCLELAFMPPDEKKGIMNSLFLPPSLVQV
jgi:hypothetical protein